MNQLQGINSQQLTTSKAIGEYSPVTIETPQPYGAKWIVEISIPFSHDLRETPPDLDGKRTSDTMDRLGWILEQGRTLEHYNAKIDGIVQYSDSFSTRDISGEVYVEIEALKARLVELSAFYEDKFKNREY